MAYNTPPSKSAGNTFTAAEWNTYIRDNQAASAPDVFAAKGDLFVATGANAGQAMTAGADYSIIEALATETVGMRWTDSPVGAILYKSSTTNIADNTDVQITGFDTTQYTKGGLISGDSFVIPIGGVYLLTAYISYAGTGSSNKLRQMGIKSDKHSPSIVWQSAVADADGQTGYITCSRIISASYSPQTFTMWVKQRSGSGLDMYAPVFAVMKIR